MLPPSPELLLIETPRVLSHAFADSVSARLSSLSAQHRVVVLVGASEEVFSLGMDLQTFVQERQDPRVAVEAIGEALVAIGRCPLPTLGLARGRAVGGGVGLLAACDLVVASAEASFGLPELLWGFVPAAIWPVICARIGTARARTWALTAHSRTAEEAQRAGLVDEVSDRMGFEAAARRALRQLRRVDPQAVRTLRRWSAEAPTLPWEDAVRKGAALSAAQLADPRVLDRLTSWFLEDVAPWGGQP